MIDPSTHPTRLLRLVAGLARWSLGLLLAFWLLLTIAWGALHGWIVPRIGDFRPQLEAQAARALGLPVRIGAIAARTEGLIPSIELSDVALLDAAGRSALRLPRVQAGQVVECVIEREDVAGAVGGRLLVEGDENQLATALGGVAAPRGFDEHLPHGTCGDPFEVESRGRAEPG